MSLLTVSELVQGVLFSMLASEIYLTLHPQVKDSDSSSDYSDDEVIIRGRSEPLEARPILSIRE